MRARAVAGLAVRFGGLIALLAAIWTLAVVNLVTGYALLPWFGLVPRTASGFDGIAFMPLLHGSLGHAAANTPPLLVLGAAVTLTAREVALRATAVIVVLGGGAVWLLGARAIHVGASGLIFGWFGFLLTHGLLERRPAPALAAIAVALIYGTMIWGVLPGRPGVSWEAHLFGALAGVAAAVLLRRR